MTYFLDFERTLFNTDAFAARIRSGIPVAPEELKSFVYADVPEFLRMAGNEAIIVTSGSQAEQLPKIEQALAGIPRLSVLCVGVTPKGEYLKDRMRAYGSSPVFTDDSLSQLESVSQHCPQAKVFEMRRDGGAGDGRWPVIRSLTELP